MKILATGSHGSGKTTLAKPLAELLDAVYVDDKYINETTAYSPINGDNIPNLHDCMNFFANGVTAGGKIVIMDTLIYPYLARKLLSPDFLISMEAIDPLPTVSEYKADYVVSEWFDDTHQQLHNILKYYRNANRPTGEFITTINA